MSVPYTDGRTKNLLTLSIKNGWAVFLTFSSIRSSTLPITPIMNYEINHKLNFEMTFELNYELHQG